MLFLFWLFPAFVQAQGIPVSPVVQKSLEATGTSDFFIVLKDDPQARLLGEARAISDLKARRRFLVEHLQIETFQSQSGLGLWLHRQGVDYQHFWIVNQILVKKGTPALLQKVLTRKEVLRIDANPWVKLPIIEPQPPPPREKMPGAIEWNILNIKADQVWSTYGVTGANVVVAVNDTGVYWNHEALKNQYRGWDGQTADHQYSWHDAIHTTIHGSSCGVNTPDPCDDYGHGTHVTGTIAGQAPNNQIGVAPGAKWIACRNMDNGYGTPGTYMECFQWFLAPGGDPSYAPHIVNNSWSCPPDEGCSQGTLETAVNTVVAAGIMVVVSNGNEGEGGCSTTVDPPAIYPQSFSVGATDNDDNLATFSSRGPVTYKGATYIKPDISAPGVGIRSSLNNGGYVSWEGTSMAAPHIAGAAALLWSGNPQLIGNIEGTEQILKSSARPRDYTSCGDPAGVPNNGYGYGIVDVFSAFQKAKLQAISPSLMLLLD
jgi:subtilisin family serine protease